MDARPSYVCRDVAPRGLSIAHDELCPLAVESLRFPRFEKASMEISFPLPL
jgi:hypothetical protein